MFNKIYERKEYMIIKVKNGYVVYNSKKEFKEGHTHLKNYNMCKVLIDNLIKRKIPRTDNVYILTSHIRVSNDQDYNEEIKQMIIKKKTKEKLRKKF